MSFISDLSALRNNRNTRYRTYSKYSNTRAGANSVDPDQTPQNAASDQGQHCLHLSTALDTSTVSKMQFKIQDKYGKAFRRPNTSKGQIRYILA